MAADIWLYKFVQESWHIEGIDIESERAQARGDWEVFSGIHERFLAADTITAEDIEIAAAAFTGGKGKLRIHMGYDVRVGRHVPPRGGANIMVKLDEIVDNANMMLEQVSPRNLEMYIHQVHCDYETLHPFLDGNGRTGRMLWARMMEKAGIDPAWRQRGFLHTWYYQSLQRNR